LEIAECLLFLLAKSYQKVHQKSREMLKPYGLTPIQSLVIAFIVEKELPISAREITKELKLDTATLSGILERLEAGGWVERMTSEKDKRLALISPSNKTIDIKNEIDEKRKLCEAEIFEKFSTGEELFFKRMLKDLRL
jgi:DNA-binding MarR family transcriptional regulator